MRRTVRLSLLLLIALASALALCALLPFLKEGWSTQAWWYLIADIVVLSALLLLWRWLHRGDLRRAGPMYVSGLILSGLPLAICGIIASIAASYVVRGQLLQRNLAITGYQSDSIYWPGIKEPVGRRLVIDLEAPFLMAGSFLSPKVLVAHAPEADTTPLDRYLGHCAPAADDICVTVPVFPYRPPSAVASGAPMRLTYDLVPASVEHLESPGRVCLSDKTATAGFESAAVRALWIFAGEGNVVVDLSDALTARLASDRSVEWTPAAIRGMYGRVEKEALVRAGYRPCKLRDTSGSCYCHP